MIVDPDFLDHWRTRMLVDALGGDESAPLYVIRIWSHCQQRRGDSFEMPAAGLRALCRAPGDVEQFEAAMIAAGFVARDGAVLSVPKWSEKNASLIAAWENGNKGGRPKKEPKGNPRVTTGEPSGNPDGTHAEPRREEKRREELSPATAKTGGAARPARKCPESFAVTGEMAAWAEHGAPQVSVELETEKFRDHTFKNSISDWPGAWRNWIRRAAENSRGPPKTGKHTGFESKDYRQGVEADGTLA